MQATSFQPRILWQSTTDRMHAGRAATMAEKTSSCNRDLAGKTRHELPKGRLVHRSVDGSSVFKATSEGHPWLGSILPWLPIGAVSEM